MYRAFFCLCGNIAACSYDEERICIAIRVFDIESAEKDGGGSYDSLAQQKVFAKLGYGW